MKLHTKINWLLFMAHDVVMYYIPCASKSQ